MKYVYCLKKILTNKYTQIQQKYALTSTGLKNKNMHSSWCSCTFEHLLLTNIFEVDVSIVLPFLPKPDFWFFPCALKQVCGRQAGKFSYLRVPSVLAKRFIVLGTEE